MQPTTHWKKHVTDPKRVQCAQTKQKLIVEMDRFFGDLGFLNIKTPLLVPCPGMEVHIRPFQTKQGPYLHTSPEFAMKKLLVGGLNKIYQLTKAFRFEPLSNTHLPEFEILEWYRTQAGMEEILSDTENLIQYLALQIFGKPQIIYQGQKIDVRTPWPRFKINQLFIDQLGIDLRQCKKSDLFKQCQDHKLNPAPQDTWDDLYFRLWLNLIEPNLPKNQAVFVTHYPPSQAALSVKQMDEQGYFWAKRFEFYIAGIECGNAFEELTDPKEQETRFISDMEERKQIYGDTFKPTPLPHEFLEALKQGLPPSGGIAVGFDRLVMLFSDCNDIAKTVWLTPYCL